MDKFILDFFQSFTSSNHFILNNILIFFTQLGNYGMIWLLISSILLLFKSTRKVGFVSFLSLIFSYLISNLILKNIIARPRPFSTYTLKILIPLPKDFSFPSGHSSSSFSSSVSIFLSGKKTLSKWLRVSFVLLAMLISFSRIYLSVHYFSDVLAGSLIGIICGILSYVLIKYFLDF